MDLLFKCKTHNKNSFSDKSNKLKIIHHLHKRGDPNITVMTALGRAELQLYNVHIRSATCALSNSWGRALSVELQLNIFEGFWVSLSFNVITTLSLHSAFIFFLLYINLTVKFIYSCIVKKAYKINKWGKLKQDRGFLVSKTMNYQYTTYLISGIL